MKRLFNPKKTLFGFYMLKKVMVTVTNNNNNVFVHVFAVTVFHCM